MGRKLIILQVEDSDSDVALAAYAFERLATHHPVHVVKDGIEALKFLRQEDGYRQAPRPDLVLLDIGLPKLDGLDVLSQIKSDAALKDIPVVIFSTSTAAASLQTAYERQANSYVVKPAEFQAYMAAIESIEAYWARTATVPGHASAGES
jgi:CheY-like chemotaxis protein